MELWPSDKKKLGNVPTLGYGMGRYAASPTKYLGPDLKFSTVVWTTIQISRNEYRNSPSRKTSSVHLYTLYMWEEGKCKRERYRQHSENSLQRCDRLGTERTLFIACREVQAPAGILCTSSWLLSIARALPHFWFSLCYPPHCSAAHGPAAHDVPRHVSHKPPGAELHLPKPRSAGKSRSSSPSLSLVPQMEEDLIS